MDIRDLILGTFEDYWNRFERALEGLTSADLAWRPQAECNPMGFIAWHMGRVEDRYIQHCGPAGAFAQKPTVLHKVL